MMLSDERLAEMQRAVGRGWYLTITQSREIISEVERLRATLQTAREALGQVQWFRNYVDPDSGINGSEYDLCPLCDQSEARGHAPDCLVWIALTAIDAVVPRAEANR